jgi:acyl-CoA thioesterase
MEALGSLKSISALLKKGRRHPFLQKNQNGEQRIEQCQFNPKEERRTIESQKDKKKKHARVRHKQTPPPQHGPGGGKVALSQRLRQLIGKLP